MFNEERSEDMMGLSPKKSFLVGLGAGVLILCSVGFFILLGVMLKGGGISLGGGSGSPLAVAPAAAAPTDDSYAPETVGEVAPVTDADHIRGNKNADITLVEYSDFECPFCQRFHPVMEQVMSEYGNKVRWVYRHYPLSFHPSAVPAANAAECASEQGKFWEYADQLFAEPNHSNLGDATYKKIAGDVKLNVSKWQTCYDAKKYSGEISADQASGNTAGISGTPGTIIIGKDGEKVLIPGAYPFDAVKQMIDSVL